MLWAWPTHVVFEPMDFLARLAALALRGPTEAAGKPDTIPWRLRRQQQIPIRGNTGRARQEIRAIRQDNGRAAQGDELGPTFETSVHQK